ncbi:hypothetical protein BCR44DRAFT_1520651 [Catenaria anguillulae PL171]|uniref:Uncharacterized protein n=1 Tax=Catenaria anguillulae PL171 TaxID=765915 RepID=A0A1Y2H219_9FUNG|nr:hypothetical protein BCR44DRAFT_1520651 [Catenaria anguillulae PL171]
MSDAMVVDAMASLITAWVGPMPHSVHQEPALSHLQRTYKVSRIVNERSLSGFRFCKVAFTCQEDLASATSKSPMYFRGQFLHVLDNLQVWLDKRSAVNKNVQVLCPYKAVWRCLGELLAKGQALMVDNSRVSLLSTMRSSAAPALVAAQLLAVQHRAARLHLLSSLLSSSLSARAS